MSDWWVHRYYHADPIYLFAWIGWVIASIVLHELGHGIVAERQGDPTPRALGRLTLNPGVHIPGMAWVLFAFLGFTWGVMPIDPRYFRHGRWSRALVAAAGYPSFLFHNRSRGSFRTSSVRFSRSLLNSSFSGAWFSKAMVPIVCLSLFNATLRARPRSTSDSGLRGRGCITRSQDRPSNIFFNVPTCRSIFPASICARCDCGICARSASSACVIRR